MAKEKKENTVKALTPGQYWEWRCTIEEMSTAKQKQMVLNLQSQIMAKDVEISTLKLQLFRALKLKDADGLIDGARAEYERLKKVLEDSLGLSLNGKMIDEVTFEVKDLPQDDTNKNPGG